MQAYIKFFIHVVLGIAATALGPLIRVVFTAINGFHGEGKQLASTLGDIHKMVNSK